MPNFVVSFPPSSKPGGATRTVVRILEIWNLNDAQSSQLLGVSEEEFRGWKVAAPAEYDLPLEGLERVSYLLGIYKALHIIIPDKVLADSWITGPNDGPLFGGVPPLSHMLIGGISSLRDVRLYLDSHLDGG